MDKTNPKIFKVSIEKKNYDATVDSNVKHFTESDSYSIANFIYQNLREAIDDKSKGIIEILNTKENKTSLTATFDFE